MVKKMKKAKKSKAKKAKKLVAKTVQTRFGKKKIVGKLGKPFKA